MEIWQGRRSDEGAWQPRAHRRPKQPLVEETICREARDIASAEVECRDGGQLPDDLAHRLNVDIVWHAVADHLEQGAIELVLRLHVGGFGRAARPAADRRGAPRGDIERAADITL